MLYIQTDKIKISTVGASFTATFSVAPDEIGFLTVLHKMYSEMNMSGFTIKPSDSENPNNCETCLHAGECDWEPWQECPYAPKTEPQTCENRECKNYDTINDHCMFIEQCHYEPKTEPQTDEPTWEQVKEYCNKRCLDIVDSAMRKQWYKDEPQTDCAWGEGEE